MEPPPLAAGGQIVKRMGDGAMAVFADPATAVEAVLAALEAVKEVAVDGYTPRVRAGVHTGRPQRISSDRLGVDVNIASRLMDRASRGGLVVSGDTLERVSQERMESMDASVKHVRRQLFSANMADVPEDLVMYWVKQRGAAAGEVVDDGTTPGA